MRLLKLWVALVLLGLLSIVPFAQADGTHTADPVDPAVQEQALALLSDVVGLDLAKYNVTLRVNQSWHFVPDLPSKQMLTYNLTSGQNVLDASFEATNNAGISLTMLSSLSGTPLLVNPANDVLGETKVFLHRYLNYSKTEYVQDMRYMLNAVTELKATKVVMGNLTLRVTQSDYVTTFEWTHTVDNITNTHSRFGFQFQDGLVHMLFDEWTAYDIPEPQINISREEVINRTIEYGPEYAAKYITDNGIRSGLPAILYDKVTADLSLQPREGKLYPQWDIKLPLVKTMPAPLTISPDNPDYGFYKFYYDGAVSFYNSNRTSVIHVAMWADTGEIAQIYGGVIILGSDAEEHPSDNLPTIILPYIKGTTIDSEAAGTTDPEITQEPTASPSPTASTAPSTTPQQPASKSAATVTLALSAEVACLISVTSGIGIIALAFLIWKRQTEA